MKSFGIFIVFLCLCAGLSSAAVTFNAPTPANNTVIGNTSFIINVSVSQGNISNFTLNWNGTNFTIFNNSLVAMYNFDNVDALNENSTLAIDHTGHGNNLTLHGPNSAINATAGKYAGAAVLAGDGYLYSSNISSTLGSNVTICTWLKTTDSNVVIVHINRDPTSFLNELALEVGLFGTLHFWDFNNSAFGFNDGFTYTSVLLNDGVWHHACFVKAGTTGKFYVDGAQDGGNATAATDVTYGQGHLVVGTDYRDHNNNLTGSIDELRIWNTSLGATDIYEQYVSNLARYNTTVWTFYSNQSKSPSAGLDDGVYTYYSSVTNSTSVTASTETRTIIVDTTSPSLSFVSPTNDDNARTFNITVPANVSLTEQNLKEFGWEWDGTNYEMYNDSLALMLNFDNVSSLGEDANTVADAGPSAQRGVVAGPAWNDSGKYGGAFVFDGTNDNISFSNSSIYRIQNLTIEAWIYIDSSAGVQNTVLSYGHGTTSGGAVDGSAESFALLYSSALESFRFRLKDAAGTSFFDLYNSSVPTSQVYDQWVFVTAVWNGSGGTIYRNAVPVLSASGSGTINYPADPLARLSVGNWFGNDERWFKGKIDEIRLYNRSFSPDEITQHYYSNLAKLSNNSWSFVSSEQFVSGGTHTYLAYAKDMTGHSGQASRSLFVDTNPERTPSPERSTFEVSKEFDCGQGVLFVTVESGGDSVSDALVRLLEDGTQTVQDTSNSQGIARFNVVPGREYSLQLSKSGFRNLAVGPFEDTCALAPSCQSGADCQGDESCTAGVCTPVTQGACGTITDHAWVDYECCNDADCGSGTCTSHLCVQESPLRSDGPQSPPSNSGNNEASKEPLPSAVGSTTAVTSDSSSSSGAVPSAVQAPKPSGTGMQNSLFAFAAISGLLLLGAGYYLWGRGKGKKDSFHVRR